MPIHHGSGMIPISRELVELLFEKGYNKKLLNRNRNICVRV